MFEWLRYGFDEKDERELYVEKKPEDQGLNPMPTINGENVLQVQLPPRNEAQEAAKAAQEQPQLVEDSESSSEEAPEEQESGRDIDLSEMPPLEDAGHQCDAVATTGAYKLRERKAVNYNPEPQKRRAPAAAAMHHRT